MIVNRKSKTGNYKEWICTIKLNEQIIEKRFLGVGNVACRLLNVEGISDIHCQSNLEINDNL